MTFRTVRMITWAMFIIIWLSLIMGSYVFLKKPLVCSPITVVPFAIESSGCYQLNEDLHLKDLSGTGILIRSSNVRLDLGGHRIVGPSSPHGRGVGIAAQGVHDVLVENGTITGFLYGIRVEGRKSRITDRFTLKKVSLLNNGFRGAAIEGNNTLVENVLVAHTGGSLFFPNAFAIGLDIAGPYCRIRRNQVLETHPVGKGEGVGISLSNNVEACVVEENVLRNSPLPGESATFGILIRGGSPSPALINNRADGFTRDFSSSCFSVTDLPYAIDTPGCYLVRDNLGIKYPNGTGILIRSSNVHLDLGGYRISGSASPTGSGIGIYLVHGVRDVVVENGAVSGFLYGVRVVRGEQNRITDRFTLRKLALEDNGFRGAAIEGNNTVIEDVTVERTGGSLFFPDAFAVGIELAGADCRVRRNQVLETYPMGKGQGIGILLTPGVRGCTVEDNAVKNSVPRSDVMTFGILSRDGDRRTRIINNQINGFTRSLN